MATVLDRGRRWVAASLFGVMAVTVLAGMLFEWRPPGAAARSLEMAAMVVFAALAIVAAYLFPIHIHQHTKVAMTTVPLFLAAALLPMPWAVLTVTGATLLGELAVRHERGNLPIDIAITTLRWSVIILIAGLVANAPAASPLGQTARLLATALVLFLGDSLTAALHVTLVSHESVWVVLRLLWRESGVVELVQYLLGFLGAFAALQHFWSPVLLLLPLAVLYVSFKNSKELQDSTRQMLEGMADAVDMRDSDTGGHSRRVGDLCAATLRQMGMRGPETDLIVSAARVHDIGKIGTPDSILRKAGKLDAHEMAVMQSHAPQGAAMLQRYHNFARGADIVRHHHERWDGHGYPSGLAGTSIPFGSRVIAVADSFDAMTSTRPYRGPMTLDEASRVLLAGRGSQWDSEVVDVFLLAVADRLRAPAALPRSAPLASGQLHAS